MKKPLFYALSILVFLGITLCVAWKLRTTLIKAFFNNPVLDGLILTLLAYGIIRNLVLIGQIWPLSRWISTVHLRKGALSVDAVPHSVLLAPITRLITSDTSSASFSATRLEYALDNFADRLDEKREVNRYLGGLLIFLGLLGTFYGLLLTVSSISDVISSLSINAENLSSMFDHLKEGLAKPLYGMGTAFSGSMFGLAGALVIGFIDLLMGKALYHFQIHTEDRLTQILHISEASPSALRLDESTFSPSLEANPASPYYTGSLLAQTAENIEQLRLYMQTMETARLEQTQMLNTLAQRSLHLEKIVETLQTTQQQTLAMQASLVESLTAENTFLPSDLTSRLETLNALLSRQHTELTDTIRTESKLISRTLAHTLSTLSSHFSKKE